MVFEIYKDSKGEFRWRLKAKNGKILADSAEGYKSKSSVKKIIPKIIMGILHSMGNMEMEEEGFGIMPTQLTKPIEYPIMDLTRQ